MNRKKLIVAAIGLAIFAAAVFWITNASNKDVIEHDYTFTGEDTKWKATFHIKGQDVFYEKDNVIQHESSYDTTFKLIYKGDLSDLSELNELQYGYKTSLTNTKSTKHFDTPPDRKVFVENGTGSGNIIRPDDSVIVTVQWDAQIEKFTLTPAEDRTDSD
ncbi:hypothetical protein GCM10009001_24970 [Virgibacillus siamensis]|uniref:Secreted protein n=1 Tax=Virgibacillus siamensis TaxID=480071 RepID=A0ABN1G9C5_9BACI